jgi:hypothetical protein
LATLGVEGLVALAAAAGAGVAAALEAAEEAGAGAEVEDEEEGADLTIVFGYTHMSKVFLS